MTDSVITVLSALLAVRQVLRARTPGTPAGDADEEHEDNTFNLPEGRLIRRAFKRFAKRQLKQTLSSLPAIGAPLPVRFKPLADWNDPMASAMTPLVGLYWDEAGQTTRARLGLDPEQWEVHDPKLHQKIREQAFQFCQSTNETTDKELGEALDDLRQQFVEGLVDQGDTIPELTRRVQSVFGRLSNTRAEMIARTEACRAVHAAAIESAKESGVVSGKVWLLSGDACPYCHELAAKFKGGLALDGSFDNDGKDSPYSDCQGPPAHPNCRCSLTFKLTDEYERLLAEHGPPEPELFDYEGGSLGPEPKKRKITRPPKPPRQSAAPKPQPLPKVIDTDLPIQDRIKQSPAVRKVKRILKFESQREKLRADRKKANDDLCAFLIAHGDITSLPPSDPKWQQCLELEKKFAEIVDRLSEIDKGIRGHVDKILGIPTARREIWDHRDATSNWGSMTHQAQARKSAREWLEPKVARGPSAGPVTVNWEAKDGVRAWAHKGRQEILVSTTSAAKTHVHELGHHVEYTQPGAQKAAQEFLSYRTAGGRIQKMKAVLPGRNYRDDELTRGDDDWRKTFGDYAWYVGKHYSFGSTEIISMGLEQLYEDPISFAKTDPEYCAFIIGILDGTLRAP
jgi:Phage Mu protein F like protein